MRLTFQLILILTFLNCQAQITETEQVNLSSIKEDLIKNGTSSIYYKSNYAFVCNTLDSTFIELLEKIEPNFIDSLNLDKDDFPEFLTDYLLTHSQNYKTSCINLRELFNDINCRTIFFKKLLKTDYKESNNLNSVIYNGNKATFSISSYSWTSIYWIKMIDNKIQVAEVSTTHESYIPTDY